MGRWHLDREELNSLPDSTVSDMLLWLQAEGDAAKG